MSFGTSPTAANMSNQEERENLRRMEGNQIVETRENCRGLERIEAAFRSITSSHKIRFIVLAKQAKLSSTTPTSNFKMRFSTPLSTSISSAPVTRKEPKQMLSLAHNGPSATGPIKASPVKPLSQADKDTKAVRIVNPNFRKLNVKATDNYVAPVSKLSQYYASDPTKAKKEFLTVRKGNNIIAKSNKFETQNMAIGKKAQQLQEIADKTLVTENRKQFETPTKDEKASTVESLKTVVELDVVDEATTQESLKSVVEPEVVDEATPITEPEMPAIGLVELDEEFVEVDEVIELDDDFPLEIETKNEVVAVDMPMEEGKNIEQDEMSELTHTNETAPAVSVEVSGVEITEGEETEVNKPFDEIAEDEEAEVKKSFDEAKKSFGPGVAAPTKVQIRKQELETKEAEARRRANNPLWMLKPSWKRPHPSKGKPSDSWARTLFGKRPPKKTLAELP